MAARRAEGRRRLRVLGAVGMVVALVALAYGVTVSPLMAVESIEVRGAEHVSAEAVIAASGVADGDALVWMDEGEVAARVTARLPWVARVEVRGHLPHRVEIRVRERVAVAWVPVAGAALLVDARGWGLESVGAAPPGLVRLDGLAAAEGPGTSIDPRSVARVAAGLGPLAGRVASVSVVDGDAVVVMVDGVEVRLGELHELRAKVLGAAAVLTDLAAEGRTVRYVDVSAPETPVVG